MKIFELKLKLIRETDLGYVYDMHSNSSGYDRRKVDRILGLIASHLESKLAEAVNSDITAQDHVEVDDE